MQTPCRSLCSVVQLRSAMLARPPAAGRLPLAGAPPLVATAAAAAVAALESDAAGWLAAAEHLPLHTACAAAAVTRGQAPSLHVRLRNRQRGTPMSLMPRSAAQCCDFVSKPVHKAIPAGAAVFAGCEQAVGCSDTDQSLIASADLTPACCQIAALFRSCYAIFVIVLTCVSSSFARGVSTGRLIRRRAGERSSWHSLCSAIPGLHSPAVQCRTPVATLISETPSACAASVVKLRTSCTGVDHTVLYHGLNSA